MKWIATIIVALFMFVPTGSALAPGPWKINLTGNVIDQHGLGSRITGLVKIYALYNKPAYRGRLGTGFITCTPLNEDFSDCYMSLRLGRGQIVGHAVVPSSSTFRQLAVTGGTGLYANVGGQITMQPLGGTVVLILVDLIAFS